MKNSILLNLNNEELKNLIIDAVKDAHAEIHNHVNHEVEKDEYLSQREAAKFLRVSLPTIINWKKTNKVPYYQEGRKVLFKKSELLKVLRKNASLLK
jgi:excisionase family DNA binding protein